MKTVFIFLFSLSLYANPDRVLSQKILGVINKQFSISILKLDESFRTKAQKVKKKYKAKSINYKRLVDKYDNLKRELYFFQTDIVQRITEKTQKMNLLEKKRSYLGLKSFDKVFYPTSYLKSFSSKNYKKQKLSLLKGSMVEDFYFLFDLENLFGKLKFSEDRMKQSIYGLNLMIQKSEVKSMKQLKKALNMKKFRQIYMIHLDSLVGVTNKLKDW